MKAEDHDFKVGYSDGYGIRHITGNYDYHEGTVRTPLGFVIVYAQGGKDDDAVSSLQFIYGGRCYSRTVRKRYTPRGLVTAAWRFAREIAEDTL